MTAERDARRRHGWYSRDGARGPEQPAAQEAEVRARTFRVTSAPAFAGPRGGDVPCSVMKQ